ncbi:MAG TPA: hypothetical protein VHJ20_18285 [Polyangia bacterium]|nr:hypothetical protein [Polyangia bacterium]
MYYSASSFGQRSSKSLLVGVVAAGFVTLLAPMSARAAISLVQHSETAMTSTTQSSLTATLTGVTAGNMIVAIVTTDTNATITPPSAAWTTNTPLRVDDGARVGLAMYYYPNYPTGGTLSTTWSFSVSTGSGVVQLVELSGVMTTNPLDASGTSFGRSTTATASASAGTAIAGEFAILGYANDKTNTFGTSGSPYADIAADKSTNTTDEQAAYYNQIPQGTTVSQSLSLSGRAYWTTIAATFKPAPLYWRGGLTGCASGSTFTTTACWSKTSGGASASTAPGQYDTATFDGGGVGNCALSNTAATQVGAITMASAYTGTITQGSAQNVSLGGTLSVGGGTFNGANGRTIGTSLTGSYVGDLNVSGSGKFQGNGATVNVQNLTVSGGTFTQGAGAFATNNGGEATFSGGTSTFAGGTSTFADGLTTSGSASLTFGSGAPTVTNTATFNGGTIAFGSGKLTASDLDVEGATVTLGNSASTTTISNTITVGSGTLNLTNGSAATNLTCAGAFTQSGGTVNVNGASATIGTGISGTSDAFVQSGGTFSNATSGGSVTFGTSGGGGGDFNQTDPSAVFTSVAGSSETFNGTITATGAVTVGASTLQGSTNARKVVSIPSGGSLTLTTTFAFSSTTAMTIAGTFNGGSAGTATFTPNVTVSGTFNGGSATQTFNGTFTLTGTFNGGTTATQNFNNTTSVTTGTFNGGGATENFTSTLSMSSTGTMTPTTGTMTVTSTATMGGTVNASTGTQTYNGTTSIAGAYDGTGGTQHFGNALTISNGGSFTSGTANMTNTTAATRLVTISSGGTMTQTTGFAFNSTNTMTLAGTLTMAGTTTFAGPVTLSGAATAGTSTTFNGAVALTGSFDAAGTTTFNANCALTGSGTFDANAATVSFANPGVFSMGASTTAFNGNTGTTTFALAPTLTSGTFTVGDAGSTGAVILTSGASFSSGMTLAFPTSGSALETVGGQTITIKGTVTSSAGAATTPPKIARSSGTLGITVAFSSTSQLNVDGLEFDNSVSTGVTIADGATYTTFSHPTFKNNVANSTSTLASHLVITSSNTGGSVTITVPGAYFDATAQYNVTLNGVVGSTGVKAFFEYQSATINGARGGESFDLDSDGNDDNIPDNTSSPRYGSLVQWSYADPSDTAGAAAGPPVAAFDWNTYAYYGVYVAFKNIGGAGTADRFWMRSSAGTALYYVDIPSTEGDIVGVPRYDSLNEVSRGIDVNGDGDQLDTDVRVVYIATANGHIHKYIDDGTQFALPGSSSAWATEFFDNTKVKTITSPLMSDGTNLYFAGTNASNAVRIFGVQIASGTGEKTVVKTISTAGTGAITAPPALSVGSSTVMFCGSALATNAYAYRVIVSPGATIDAAYSSGIASNIVGMNLLNNRLTFVTANAKLYELDASKTLTGSFTVINPSFPYVPTGAGTVSASPFYDAWSNVAYYGDSSGKLYAVSATPAALTNYPYSVPGAPSITTTPYYKKLSGTIAFGGSDGYAYFINRHDASNNPQIRKKVYVGAGAVTAVSYNSNASQYMAASADGHMTYINESDIGTDTDGVE